MNKTDEIPMKMCIRCGGVGEVEVDAVPDVGAIYNPCPQCRGKGEFYDTKAIKVLIAEHFEGLRNAG